MTDITRAVAIRRGLRNLDASPAQFGPVTDALYGAIELELARAYDAGHVAGSGVKHQTDAEQHLAEVARELTEYQAQTIGVHVSLELLDALEKVRASDESKNTLTPMPDGSFDVGVEL